MRDPQIVAVHESGHAVVAAAFGLPCASIEATSEGGQFRSYEHAAWEPEDKTEFRAAVLASIGTANREEMWPTLVTLLGGLAAQSRLAVTDCDDYADADIAQASQLARALADSDQEARVILRDAKHEASAIVEAQWPASRAWPVNCRCAAASSMRSKSPLRSLLLISARQLAGAALGMRSPPVSVV
jgi:hypothetical protein